MHMHDVFSPGHCLHGPLLLTATRAHLVVLAGTECRQLVPVAGKDWGAMPADAVFGPSSTSSHPAWTV